MDGWMGVIAGTPPRLRLRDPPSAPRRRWVLRGRGVGAIFLLFIFELDLVYQQVQSGCYPNCNRGVKRCEKRALCCLFGS